MTLKRRQEITLMIVLALTLCLGLGVALFYTQKMPTSNDYVIGKYLETTVSCSHGLKYDAEKIYCKGSNSRSDGKITDVQISWKLIKEIHHNGVTLLPQEYTKSR